MTELEKQEILRNFSVVINYLSQQLDTEQTDIIQSTMLYNLTSSPLDGLSIPIMPFPFEAPSAIKDRKTQINHLTRTAEYVSNTDASDLTDESIRRFTQTPG